MKQLRNKVNYCRLHGGSMRNEKEMYGLILNIAEQDERMIYKKAKSGYAIKYEEKDAIPRI